MKLPVLTAMTLLAIGSFACTTALEVTRGTSDSRSRIGNPHPLWLSQYALNVVYRIVECSTPVTLMVSVDVNPPKAVADHENLFFVNPASLSGVFKTGAVTTTYHANGAVATLNATADDRTLEVVTGVASLVVSLAKFGAVPSLADPATPPVPRCKPEIVNALKSLGSQSDAVKTTALALDRSVEELKRVTDKAASMGSNVDEATKKQLSAALDSVTANRTANDAAKEVLGKTLEIVSYKAEVLWPAKASDRKHQVQIPDSVMANWLVVAPTEDDRRQGSVFASLTPLVLLPERSSDVEVGHGVPIRVGASGKLSICRFAPCSEAGSVAIGSPRNDEILQLGYVAYMPCVSRPFTSIECSLELTESGGIKSMGTKSLKSAAEGAVGAANAVADAATERRVITREAELRRLEAETALLKARQENAAATQALQTSNPQLAVDTASATARASYYNAVRSELEAEAQLAATRGRLASP